MRRLRTWGCFSLVKTQVIQVHLENTRVCQIWRPCVTVLKAEHCQTKISVVLMLYHGVFAMFVIQCRTLTSIVLFMFSLCLHWFGQLILDDFLRSSLYERARWGPITVFVIDLIHSMRMPRIHGSTVRHFEILVTFMHVLHFCCLNRLFFNLYPLRTQVTCKGSDGVSYSDNRCTTGEPPLRSRVCGTGICACEACSWVRMRKPWNQIGGPIIVSTPDIKHDKISLIRCNWCRLVPSYL